MKDEAGADFTITPRSVSPPMASSFPSGAVFPPQPAPAMLDYAPPRSRKASGRAVRRIRRQTHFRPQGKGAILLQTDDSPEIESVPIPERIGIPPAPAKAQPSRQPIQCAPNLP